MDLISFASFGCWTNARPFGIRLFHIFSVSALGSPAKLSLSDQTTFSILRCGLPYGVRYPSISRSILSSLLKPRPIERPRNATKMYPHTCMRQERSDRRGPLLSKSLLSSSHSSRSVELGEMHASLSPSVAPCDRRWYDEIFFVKGLRFGITATCQYS